MSEIIESIIDNLYYSKINLSKMSFWGKDKYCEVENLPKVFFSSILIALIIELAASQFFTKDVSVLKYILTFLVEFIVIFICSCLFIFRVDKTKQVKKLFLNEFSLNPKEILSNKQLLITLSQNEKKMLEDLFYYLETKDIESAENFDNKSKEFINKVISSGILTEKEQRKVLSSDSKCYIVMMEGDYNYVKDYSGHFGEGFTIYYNRFLEYEDFEKEVKMDSEGVLRVRKYKYGLLTCKNVKKILDILTNN